MKNEKIVKNKRIIIIILLTIFTIITIQFLKSQAKYYSVYDAGTIDLTIIGKDNIRIIFDANSGIIENMEGVEKYSIQDGKTIKRVKNGGKYGKLPSATPVSSSYQFLGWYTSLDGDTKITEKTIVNIDEDITLYARWRLKNVKVELPDTFPTSTQNSPLVPNWTLGSASLKMSSNSQKYESILLTKAKTEIDITDLPADSTIKTWYNEIGKEMYYIPTIPEGCKKVKITMDEGYNSVKSRKNPKVIFVQGNSISKLIPNGTADGKGGQTDIPNTFGERQIVENPTEVYQIKNGEIIDLSSYWDDSYEYHALVLRGYDNISVSNIKGATIEYIYDEDESENTTDEEETEIVEASVKVNITDTVPQTSQSSPLVPTWTLGTASLRISSNPQTYESILLTKTKTDIDVTDIAYGTTEVKDWYDEIGKEIYYIPTIPDGCKKVRITMDEGYNSVNSRKNPKVIFVQGNSASNLIPNGIADGSGGQTDIPNTFGERQIVEEPVEVYQIKNGDIIDLSPYWDSGYKYHAIVIRGYDNVSVNNIKGATIEYIRTGDEENKTEGEEPDNTNVDYSLLGTVTKTVSKAFQGSLVDEKNKELYQFFDGGHCMIVNMETLETIREIDLPSTRGSGHYSSVEWLDVDKKIFMTTCCVGSQITYASDIYVYDIQDETDVKITTLTCPEMNSDNYSYMADLAYDKDNKLLYVGGYTPSGGTRNNLYISTIDMSPYINNNETTVHVIGEPFTEQIYHLQDGTFYNGKIYYLVDSTSGKGSYNCFSVLEINPTTKKITRVLEVELSSYKEAESISIVSGSNPYIIMGYSYGDKEYYYKKML